MIGTTVGSYRITAKVSVGGMGTVYKAEHTLIGKQAAVKILHPELRNNREVVNRFFNEAKATTQIKHPGIVEVFDFGYMPSGDGYIVMEFLEGVSLARRLRKGKMPEGKAALLLRGVCSALAAAHAKGIVHRDLKPDNIFLCPDPDAPTGERPKILDFGIAKLSDIGLAGAQNATKTGAVMGTPTYMSPEQCKGTGNVDHRADLYSLGCIFYELLSGVPPFVAEGAGELIGMHLFLEPQSPTSHDPSISKTADALVMALLDKDPANRPQTARELGQRFTLLAQSTGWLANVTPTAMAEAMAAAEDDEAGSDIDDTEAVPSPKDAIRGDGMPLAPTSTPDEAANAALRARPPAAHTPKPTTLSGAASQSVIGGGGSRRMLWIGAAGLAAAAVATVAIVMVTGGDKKPAGSPTPAVTTPAPEPAPPPKPEPPAPEPPKPLDPPHVEAAAPAPPEPPPKPTPKPAKPEVAKPSITRVKPPKPKADTVKATTAKPDLTKTGKPDATKQAPPPTQGSGSKILIEKDI